MSRHKTRFRTIDDLLLVAMHSSGKSFGISRGRKVFVEGGIPGEMVCVQVDKTKRDYLRGSITSITRPSAERTLPFCRHAGLCGGCNWQHIAYGEQLKLKRKILLQALEKYEITVPEVPKVIPSPHTLFFRNKLEFTFTDTRWFYEEEGEISDPREREALGFHVTGMPGRVLDIRECRLMPGPVMEVCRAARASAAEHCLDFYSIKQKTGLLKNLVMRTATGGGAMVIAGFAQDVPEQAKYYLDDLSRVAGITAVYYRTYGETGAGTCIPWRITFPFLQECCNCLTFRYGPDSFFQPNPEQAAGIFSKIKEIAALQGDEHVFDLYCGIGTIALTLAESCRQVTGIEGSALAVRDAAENARLNHIGNAEFIHGDILETFTREFVDRHEKPGLIVLDPPRSGTLTEIKKAILHAAPDKIIYLSCNPVSLAYDLKQLQEKYRVAFIQPYDMFPHTHQVESLVLLEKYCD